MHLNVNLMHNLKVHISYYELLQLIFQLSNLSSAKSMRPYLISWKEGKNPRYSNVMCISASSSPLATNICQQSQFIITAFSCAVWHEIRGISFIWVAINQLYEASEMDNTCTFCGKWCYTIFLVAKVHNFSNCIFTQGNSQIFYPKYEQWYKEPTNSMHV